MEMYGNFEKTVTNHSKTEHVCRDCGSSDITERVWVNYNTREFESDIDDGEIYCNSCEDYIEVITRQEWDDEKEEEEPEPAMA